MDEIEKEAKEEYEAREAGWRLLAGALGRYEKESHAKSVAVNIMLEGFERDPTLLQMAARSVLRTLLFEQEFSPADRWFVAMLLNGVETDSEIAGSYVFRKGLPGARRKGEKAARLAYLVLHAIAKQRARSVEGAWQLVADEENVSVQLVKRSWIDWKDRIAALEAGDAFDPETYWQKVKAKLAANRKA